MPKVIWNRPGNPGRAVSNALGIERWQLRAAVKAYASLRFVGDALDPREISRILGVDATRAYRKGERYCAGPRTGELTGRTGIWLLITDGLVDSRELKDHVQYLVDLIFRDDQRAVRLRQMIAEENLKAQLSCFWHGTAGARAPVVSRAAIEAFSTLPAAIETDFDTD